MKASALIVTPIVSSNTVDRRCHDERPQGLQRVVGADHELSR